MYRSTHTGEEFFSDNQCSNSLLKGGKLKMHRKTHTSEKLFSCDQCSKSFLKGGTLKVNRRTQTGEKNIYVISVQTDFWEVAVWRCIEEPYC